MVCDLVLEGKSQKLPALSGDLAYTVLKFHRVVPEVTPGVLGKAPCVPPHQLAAQEGLAS